MTSKLKKLSYRKMYLIILFVFVSQAFLYLFSTLKPSSQPSHDKIGLNSLQLSWNNTHLQKLDSQFSNVHFECWGADQKFYTVSSYRRKIDQYFDYPSYGNTNPFPIAITFDSWLYNRKYFCGGLGVFSSFEKKKICEIMNFESLSTIQRDKWYEKRLAIIIPIRRRCDQLAGLVPFLHFFLQKKFFFKIFVVEQKDERVFSRGSLMNVGARIALDYAKKHDFSFDYFIFHDVDLLPESPLNSYSFHEDVIFRVGMRNDFFKFSESGERIRSYRECISYGGVTQIPVNIFLGINGFSNRYWGWGREDDDLNQRLLAYFNVTNYGTTTRTPYSKVGHVWAIPDSSERKDRGDKETGQGVEGRGNSVEYWEFVNDYSNEEKIQFTKSDGLSTARFDILKTTFNDWRMVFTSIRFTFPDQRGLL